MASRISRATPATLWRGDAGPPSYRAFESLGSLGKGTAKRRRALITVLVPTRRPTADGRCCTNDLPFSPHDPDVHDMTTARAPFVAGTPDRPTFFADPQHDPRRGSIHLPPAASQVLASSSGWLQRPRAVWGTFLKTAKDVVDNNVGMLLVAASQVRGQI